MLRVLLLTLTAIVTLPAFHQAAKPDQPPRQFEKGVVIELQGVILPQLEKYLDRKLEQARKSGADLVILEIDSPGGVLETSLAIADKLRDLPWARTVAYVPDEALSGAAIIALACDDLLMAPLARLGDAGPIVAGPDALFRHAPEKIRSDLARRLRDLAAAHGRPPALAEAMVDMNLVVYRVTNRETGEVTYMSQQEIDSSDNPDAWETGPPVLESREGSFLEVNGQRAVELQLATATVSDMVDLEQRYPVTEPPLVFLRRTVVDRAVDLLNHPLVTALLFVVGAIALYVELSAPGISVGGLLSGLCFALFFWSRFLGGTAGWLEVILVLAGLAFLAVELFVIPGFGIAGILGLLLMFTGIIMASQNHLIPQTPRGLSQLRTSLLVLLASGAVSLVGVIVLSRFFGSVPLLNRLILRAPAADDVRIATATGKPLPSIRILPANVGDWGVADSPLRPAGKAVFGDEYLDVVTEGSFVERGRQVRIIEISGNRIVVREIDPQP